jgi:hypothetical protein
MTSPLFSPKLGVNYSLLRYPFVPQSSAFNWAQQLGCTLFRVDVPWNYSSGSWTSLFGKNALSSTLSTGSPITSLPVAAMTTALNSGESLTIVDPTYAHTQTWVTTAAVAKNATAIPVVSQMPNFAYTSAASIFSYDPAAAASIASLVTTAATYGIKLLFVVDGCLQTTWASGVSGNNYNTGYPITPAQFGAAMGWLVAQPGCQGLDWEIPVNEPDEYGYVTTISMSVANCVAALQAGYTAMKAADSSCTVHLFPVANVNSGGSGYTFLQGGYSAGMKGSYDVFDFHCYNYPGNGTYQNSQAGGNLITVVIPELVALRATNSDITPMVLSETGWQSTGTGQVPDMNTTLQAVYLYSFLLALSALGILQAVYIYDLADAGGNWGMLTGANVPKPSFYQIQSLTTYTVGRTS